MINDHDIVILRRIACSISAEGAESAARWAERAECVVTMLHTELPDISDEVLAFIAQLVSGAAVSLSHITVTDAGKTLDAIFTAYSLAAARLLKIDTTEVPPVPEPDEAEPSETDPGKPDHIGFYL